MEEDDYFIDFCYFLRDFLSHFSFEKGIFSNWDTVPMDLYFDSLVNTNPELP